MWSCRGSQPAPDGDTRMARRPRRAVASSPQDTHGSGEKSQKFRSLPYRRTTRESLSTPHWAHMLPSAKSDAWWTICWRGGGPAPDGIGTDLARRAALAACSACRRWRRAIADGRAGAAAAGAGGRRRGAAAAEAAAVPTGITPLIGDFDGDHRSDVFMYGPGGLPDHVWLGRPDRAFAGVPASVGRNYLPLVGDFNGNGRADILWYGPGASPGRALVRQTDGAVLRLGGDRGRHLRAAARRLQRRRRERHLLVRPGRRSDVLWYGQASGGFSGRAVTVNGSYQPLVADFNGDGRRDILWYGPGRRLRRALAGPGGGGFASRDGDHRRDLPAAAGRLERRPRPRHPLVRAGRRARRALVRARRRPLHRPAVDVAGTYQPFTGDFDGDGRRDIFWYGAGRRLRRGLVRRADGRFGAVGPPSTAPTSRWSATSAATGPTTSSGTRPGGPDDVLWFGHADAAFTSRATTLDIGYTRAAALRPDAHHQPLQPLRVRRPRHRRDRRPASTPTAWRRSSATTAAASGSSRSTWSAWPTGPPWSPTTAWRPTTA